MKIYSTRQRYSGDFIQFTGKPVWVKVETRQTAETCYIRVLSYIPERHGYEYQIAWTWAFDEGYFTYDEFRKLCKEKQFGSLSEFVIAKPMEIYSLQEMYELVGVLL